MTKDRLSPFPEGSHVLVHSLKSLGVVSKILSAKRIEVCIGDVRTICQPEDLEVTTKRRNTRTPKPTQANRLSKMHKCDLHGLTVVESIECLEKALSRALMDGAAMIEVVHGRGSGKLQSAALAYLQTSKHVKSVMPKPGNPGATLAYL